MSESDIDPEDAQLIEGASRRGDEEEWHDSDESQPAEREAKREPGRLEEREQRQDALQQHGESFAVEQDDE